MDLLDISQNTHRLIAGPTGSGKSYFVGYMVEKLYAAEKPFIILDTKTKNHIGLVGLKGLKIVKIKPNAVYDWSKLAKYPYLLLIPTFRTKTEDLIRQYTAVIDAIYTIGKERTIIVEEAHNYNKSGSAPSPILELVAREGRGRGLSLWFVTQRIQNFPKLLWSQCYSTYILKFLIPQDIRYIEALIPNFTDINRNLNKHDVLEYSHTSNEYGIVSKGDIIRKTKHYG